MSQDELYEEASSQFGADLRRLVGAYEFDADKRADLLQEIHIALWRSFSRFEQRCSLRTWVYRVAHNTAISHVIRPRRTDARILVTLEELEDVPDTSDQSRDTEQKNDAERLMDLIHRLKPFDRQIMLLYLEGMDSIAMGEVTGMPPGSVRVQIHRIKAILARRFNQRGES